MSRILLLGAGLVSRPLVHYLTDVEGLQLTVASRTLSKAEDLVRDLPRAHALRMDARDVHALGRLIAEHDVVVSLLPAALPFPMRGSPLRLVASCRFRDRR